MGEGDFAALHHISGEGVEIIGDAGAGAAGGEAGDGGAIVREAGALRIDVAFPPGGFALAAGEELGVGGEPTVLQTVGQGMTTCVGAGGWKRAFR